MYSTQYARMFARSHLLLRSPTNAGMSISSRHLGLLPSPSYPSRACTMPRMLSGGAVSFSLSVRKKINFSVCTQCARVTKSRHTARLISLSITKSLYTDKVTDHDPSFHKDVYFFFLKMRVPFFCLAIWRCRVIFLSFLIRTDVGLVSSVQM